MSENLTPEEIEWMLEGYRLFREHDPAFLDLYEPDATVVIPETLPKGGTYESPWEALEFWTHIAELVEDPHPLPEQFVRDGDNVVVLGTWHAIIPSTRREIRLRLAHVFTFGGGSGPLIGRKIQRVELFTDTAAFNEAVASVRQSRS